MSNTITIERKTTQVQSVSLNLPYYAKAEGDYYLITGQDECLRIMFGFKGNLLLVQANMGANSLPEVHEQISEDAFTRAYEKAQSEISKRVNHALYPNLSAA